MTQQQTLPRSEIRAGWFLILSACAGVACCSITLPFYSIGVLMRPVTATFGWSRAEFQSAMLLSSGLGALTAPVVGWLCDRYGPRKVALPGLVGLTLAFIAASRMNGELWTLYCAYAAIALLGAGTVPVTWTRSIALSFEAQRGLALGLTLTGTGVAAMLLPHYTVWAIERFGWRGAYVAVGLLPVLLAGPLVYWGFHARTPTASASSAPAPRYGLLPAQVLRGRRFWILLGSVLVAYLGISGIGANLFASLTDRGVSASQAATVQSVFGAAIIIGRIGVGHLVDRFWAPGVAAIALCLPVVGCVMLYGNPPLWTTVLAVILIGLAAGAELDLMLFLTARFFGVLHYSKIYSLLYSALAICGGSAPMLFAHLYDLNGSYDQSFLAAAAFFLIGALLMLMLGDYPSPADLGAGAQSRTGPSAAGL